MRTPDFQPAWLLHTRPYRETSALAWLLTLEEGRVDAVVRGVRTQKSRHRALLQPFTPLQVRLGGRSQLKNLLDLEAGSSPSSLQGEALICGLYANELLGRLLLPGVACAGLFRDYSLLLGLLAQPDQREPALRRFELSLLDTLGVLPGWLAADATPLQPEIIYCLEPQQGFVPLAEWMPPSTPTYLGRDLLALLADDWRAASTRLTAKHLTRTLLAPLLGQRPLHSRLLLQQLRSTQGVMT